VLSDGNWLEKGNEEAVEKSSLTAAKSSNFQRMVSSRLTETTRVHVTDWGIFSQGKPLSLSAGVRESHSGTFPA
jgi:hypothetical protein